MVVNKWYVQKTECYPNAWKVVNDYYCMDNASHRYWPSWEEASQVAHDLNVEGGIIPE